MSESRRTEFRFLLGSLLLFGVLSFLVFREFLYYIAFAILLTFSFFPAHERIRRVVKRPALAATVSLILVIVVVVGPLVLVGFLVFQSAVDFAKSYDPNRVNETIQPLLTRFGIGEVPGSGPDSQSRPSDVANFLGAKIQDLAQSLGKEMLIALPGLMIGLFITGFVTFYGFLEGDRFYEQLRHVLPLPDEIEESVFHQIRDVTRAVFVGTLLIAVLAAALGAVTFFIFSVPNAIFWGFLMVFVGLLPIIGAPIIWVPVCVWLFLEGHTTAALGIFLINGLLGYGYIEHILRPKIIGKMGRIHPVWVVVGVLGGVEAFGILGFVIGPLILSVFIALIRSYTEFHPRWARRRWAGREPYYPAGRIRPQPFAREPAPERRGRSRRAARGSA